MKHFPIHIPVKSKPDPLFEEIINEYYKFKIVKGSDSQFSAKTVITKSNTRIFPNTVFLKVKNEFKPYGAVFELSFNDKSIHLFLPKGFQKFLYTLNEGSSIFISLSKNRILLEIIVINNYNRFSNLLYQMYVEGDFRPVIRALSNSKDSLI